MCKHQYCNSLDSCSGNCTHTNFHSHAPHCKYTAQIYNLQEQGKGNVPRQKPFRHFKLRLVFLSGYWKSCQHILSCDCKTQEVRFSYTIWKGSTGKPEDGNSHPRGSILDKVSVVPSTITVVRKQLGGNLQMKQQKDR